MIPKDPIIKRMQHSVSSDSSYVLHMLNCWTCEEDKYLSMQLYDLLDALSLKLSENWLSILKAMIER